MSKTVTDVKLDELKDIAAFKTAFGTKDGKKCLELLKKEYYDIDFIAHNDPTITQNRAAQRDMVRAIIDKVEYKGE